MGIYAKVVSVQKEIKEIKAQVGGNTKSIASVWTIVDGIQKKVWPDGAIINLVGAAKYEKDTIWPVGRYSVDVQAGSSGWKGGGMGISAIGLGGRVATIVNISSPFIIRAYCGAMSYQDWDSGVISIGTNPYTGQFKVNPKTSNSSVSAVNHIFGNAGSMGKTSTLVEDPAVIEGSGNCLANGVMQNSNSALLPGNIAAGTCLHFLPVGGTFGTDYLAAFHACAAGVFGGGGGSAYGGAGSGAARNIHVDHSQSTYAGGSTPYGNGGAGVASPGGVYGGVSDGKDGSGVGAGHGGRLTDNTNIGAAAYFDGTNWINSDLHSETLENGHIVVTYLGPIE